MTGEPYAGTPGRSQRTAYDFNVKCLVWGVSSASKQSPTFLSGGHLEAEELKATNEQEEQQKVASGLRTLASWCLCLVWLTRRASFCLVNPRGRTESLRRVQGRQQSDFSRFPRRGRAPPTFLLSSYFSRAPPICRLWTLLEWNDKARNPSRPRWSPTLSPRHPLIPLLYPSPGTQLLNYVPPKTAAEHARA